MSGLESPPGDARRASGPDAAPSAPDLSVRLGGLHLPNPILTASGTFGYGLEFGHLTALDRLGGIVTKGLSLQPL